MSTRASRNTSRVLLAAGLLLGSAASPAPAQTVLNGDTFALLHRQIRPQPGESRWMDVPWRTDVHEARQLAAAAGKPLFLYAGGGASGIGAC